MRVFGVIVRTIPCIPYFNLRALFRKKMCEPQLSYLIVVRNLSQPSIICEWNSHDTTLPSVTADNDFRTCDYRFGPIRFCENGFTMFYLWGLWGAPLTNVTNLIERAGLASLESNFLHAYVLPKLKTEEIGDWLILIATCLKLQPFLWGIQTEKFYKVLMNDVFFVGGDS